MIDSSSIDRRKFLQLGAVGAALVAGGCESSDDSPQPLTSPPAKGGNRERLDRLKAKAAQAGADSKKK